MCAHVFGRQLQVLESHLLSISHIFVVCCGGWLAPKCVSIQALVQGPSDLPSLHQCLISECMPAISGTACAMKRQTWSSLQWNAVVPETSGYLMQKLGKFHSRVSIITTTHSMKTCCCCELRCGLNPIAICLLFDCYCVGSCIAKIKFASVL